MRHACMEFENGLQTTLQYAKVTSTQRYDSAACICRIGRHANLVLQAMRHRREVHAALEGTASR